MVFNKNGFSLIELLITVSITVILLMLVIPDEKIFITKSEDEVMSQQLLRAIYLARSEAISRGETVMLCKSVDLKHCGGNDWLQGYIMTTNDKLLSSYQNIMSKGAIHWRSFPQGRNDLKFLSSGLSEIENGTFWYCPSTSSKAHWAIMMSPSGRARLVLPDANGDIIDSSGNELSCLENPSNDRV